MKPLFLNIYFHESGAEILKALRAPEYIVPTLVLPVAFYLFFAFAMPGAGTENARYLLATYGVFAVMGPSIFGFGVGVANERDRGWLKLKRASPSPSLSYIAAKITVTLIFASLALIPIYLAAGFGAHIALPRGQWVMLLGIHLLSVIPFVLIGLTLGFSLGSNAAIAVSNIAFLGMSALGGLWIPTFLFPPLMQKISVSLPSYQLAEIALSIVGANANAGAPRMPLHNLTIVAIMTAFLAVLAYWAWAKQRN
ncbi:MAG: antibiotic transporter permease [Robiginitomaculum sp.]|nr:MAG: antibiotic transporter permease [Robiginitomaculum sp.]